MDYSAANDGLWRFIIQLGVIAGAILLAHAAYRKWKPLRRAMLPVAVLFLGSLKLPESPVWLEGRKEDKGWLDGPTHHPRAGPRPPRTRQRKRTGQSPAGSWDAASTWLGGTWGFSTV